MLKKRIKIYISFLLLSSIVSGLVFGTITFFRFREAQSYSEILSASQTRLAPNLKLTLLKSEQLVLQIDPIWEKIAALTLQEKIGQLFIWKIHGSQLSKNDQNLLENTYPAGVFISKDNITADYEKLITQIQTIEKTQKIPYFYSVDQEGGIVRRFLEDPNPGGFGLSAMPNDKLCGYINGTASLLASKNINLNFGLVGDIGWNKESFIYPRTLGFTPESTSSMVRKILRCGEASVFQTIKHFPGHGRTNLDSHKVLPKVTLTYEEWLKTDAQPFKVAFEENIHFVMNSHLIYSLVSSEPASLSSEWVSVLRNLGFQGVIITDDMGMLDASRRDPYLSAEKAIIAGNNILLYVGSQEEFSEIYSYILRKVEKGEIPLKWVEESVYRVLRVKGMKE